MRYALMIMLYLAVGVGIAATPPMPEPYMGAWINRQPEQVSWPSLANQKMIAFRTAGFRLRVPVPDSMLMPGDSLVIKSGHARLVIQEVTEKTFRSPVQRVFSRSRYSVSDYPSLMFTLRQHSREPKSIPDRWIWRYAMTEKSLMARKSVQMLVSRKGCLTAWYASFRRPSRTWVMMIVNHQYKHAFLLVYINAGNNDGRRWVNRLLSGMVVNGC